MRKKLLRELQELSTFSSDPVDHHANDRRVFLELPVNCGWTHENKRHVQRELGVVADAFVGHYDERGRFWVSFQFWSFDAGGDALDVTILARAIGHWIREGTPIQFFVIGRYIDGAKDLGVEVRIRGGTPGDNGPVALDEEFDFTFSEALFVTTLNVRLRRARGDELNNAWSWVRQTRGDS